MSDLELEANFFKNEISDLTRESGKVFIGVRIENEKDKSFWDFVLKKTIPELNIKYYPYSKTIKSGTKGKTQITPLKDFANKKLVLCIDSDYDYLLENTDLQRPFIFQTNVYALENYWSFAEGLKDIVEKTTDSEKVDFNFVAYFKSYSEVIYDWLICSLYSEKINDKQLSRENCGKAIGINKSKNIPIEMRLSDLRVHLNTLTQTFEAIYNERTDFKDFKNRLSKLGLNKETAYLFIRGHDLFDKVTIPLIKEIGEEITNKRFLSLKNTGDTEGSKKYEDYLKQHSYANYLKYHNTAYESHFLFTSIMDKIKFDFENEF